jgi:hypothetical protein
MGDEERPIVIHDPRKLMFQISGATFVVLLGMIAASIVWGRALLDVEFMTDAAYAVEKKAMKVKIQEHETEIESQVMQLAAAQEQTSKSVDLLTSEFSSLMRNIAIADAVDVYNATDDALYQHRRDEAVTGVTRSSSIRREELDRRKAAAKEYRDCVLNDFNDQRNCVALRPR